MGRIILHIDFNSFFATVEQQANPRLRGKPIGVTGGDRLERTVLGAASVEAKKFGVKTGMQIWQAKKICPEIIIVRGDGDKYLSTTTKFLNILKNFSSYLEVFSIDECFLELNSKHEARNSKEIAYEIKKCIRTQIGEAMTCSIGISYNKLMAKLASSLQKPDGLVVIKNEQEAVRVLDNAPLDEICGIGPRIKHRLNKIGLFNFRQLRAVPLGILLREFKSYGHFLYQAARGVDNTPLILFQDKPEVKSVGHRHTIDHDTANFKEIRQILLKLSEMVARRLRAKQLVGKTISCWYRPGAQGLTLDGKQITVPFTADGLEVSQASWKIFRQIWTGEKIRMIGVSVSGLKPSQPANLSLLETQIRQEKIIAAIDTINDKYGEFTLKRGVLLGTAPMNRKPNPYLSDRRFKL